MEKMTAVEWLVEQILSEVDKYNDDCTKVVGVEYWNAFISCTDLSEYVNKAKEMEKQQIIDAHNNSDPRDSGEQYYNETFAK